MKITLPYLGERTVQPDPCGMNHWLWLDSFGWHDCTTKEDRIIRKHLRSLRRA